MKKPLGSGDGQVKQKVAAVVNVRRADCLRKSSLSKRQPWKICCGGLRCLKQFIVDNQPN